MPNEFTSREVRKLYQALKTGASNLAATHASLQYKMTQAAAVVEQRLATANVAPDIILKLYDRTYYEVRAGIPVQTSGGADSLRKWKCMLRTISRTFLFLLMDRRGMRWKSPIARGRLRETIRLALNRTRRGKKIRSNLNLRKAPVPKTLKLSRRKWKKCFDGMRKGNNDLSARGQRISSTYYASRDCESDDDRDPTHAGRGAKAISHEAFLASINP